MAAFLTIISVLVFFVGISILAAGTSVLHEMLAGMLFIISAIFFSSGGIVNEIRLLRNSQK